MAGLLFVERTTCCRIVADDAVRSAVFSAAIKNTVRAVRTDACNANYVVIDLRLLYRRRWYVTDLSCSLHGIIFSECPDTINLIRYV